MYVTKKSVEEGLRVGRGVFAGFLAMVNDGELRSRKLSHGDQIIWAYRLEDACAFLTKFSYRFDKAAEARLRVSSFELAV